MILFAINFSVTFFIIKNVTEIFTQLDY